METSEISIHQARIYQFVRKHGDWITASEIAQGASVASRTARAHALKFVQLGIFDQAEVFPAHRYRFSKMEEKRNKAMVQRLQNALTIFRID